MSFNTATLINQLLVGLRNKTETKQLEFLPYTLGPPADTTNKLYSVNGLLYYNGNLLAIPGQTTAQSVNFQPPDINGNVDLRIFQNGLTSLSTIYTTDVNTSSGISGFTSLNQQIYSIQNELDTLASITAFTNLQNQVNTNTTNISTLTTDVNSLNTSLSNLTTQVNSNTSSISLLNVATYNLEQNKLNISASSQLLTGNLNINGSVSSTSLINALDFSTPQINSLNTSLSNLTTQVNSNTSSISNLNTQVSQINLNISGLSLLESKTQNISPFTSSNTTYCEDIWLFRDSSNNNVIGIQPEGTPLNPNTKLIVNGGILCDYVNTPFILSDNFKVQNVSQTTTFLQASTTTNSIIANEIIFTPTDAQINGYTFSLGQGSVQKLNVNVDNTIIQNGITSKSGINISGISNLNVVNANSLNVSGTTNLKDLNVNGNLNVYGGSFTSQSVINQYTSMSILQNPAGSVPALSITQGGGTNAIFEVVDSDSNIKLQINQDCDVNINDKINMDSGTGNITSLGTLNCSAINVANNFTSNATSSQFVNDTYIGDNGIEILTAESPLLPVLPSTYNGTVYQIHNETELTNAIASAVDFDILELRGDITLIATATINKNLKLTSHNTRRFISYNVLNATTINWTGQGGYVDNVEIRSLGTGSNEVGLYLNNQSGNFVVNNCLLNVDEFGISCNVNSFIISNSTFNYARLPANESMRYIQLLKTGANSVNYIHNNVFNGIASGDASIQCISTANAGLNAFPSSTFSITNNTSSGTVQRLFMMDSTNMTGNNCTWYLMNNVLTCSSGFYIWYHPSALISQVAFYCSGNTETLGGSATGSKGLIGLDSIGLITSVNYSCKFFGKNNNIPALRADYSDLSQNNSRVIAYNNTKLTPTQTFDTVYYDNVNIDGILNVNSNSTFTKNVSITGTVSASNLSGTNTGDQNVLSSLAVSGQTTISMTGNTTLNISSGSGISLTTDNINKVLTITGTPSQNTFGTLAVSGQSNITANTTNTTLNLIAGTGMSILTDDITKSITLNSTGGSGGSGPTWTDTADTYSIAGNFDQAPSITDVNTLVAGRQIKPLCITNTYALFGRSYTDNGNSPYLIYVYGVSNGTLTFQSQYTYNISPITTTYGINAVASGNNIFVSCAGFGSSRVDLLTYNAGTLSQTNIWTLSFSNDSYMVMDYKDVYTTGGTTYGVLTWGISYFNISGYIPAFYAFWHNQTTNSFTQIANPSFGQPLSTSVGNAGQVKIVGDYSRNLYEIVLYDGAKLYEIGISKNGTSTPSLSQTDIFTFSNNFPSSKYNDVSNPTLIVDDEDTTTNINFLHIVFPKSQGDIGINTGGCVLSYRYLSNGKLTGSLDNSQIWQLDDIYTLQTNSFWGGRNSVFNSYTNGNYGFVKNGQMVMPSSGFQGLAQITLNRSATIPYLTPQPLGSLLYPFNNTPTAPVGGFMTILVSPDGNNMIGVIQNSSGDTNKRIFIYQRGSAGTVSILWKQTSDNIKETNYLAVSDTTGIFKLPVRTLSSVQSLFPALQNGFSFIDSTSGTIKVYYNGTFKTITWT